MEGYEVNKNFFMDLNIRLGNVKIKQCYLHLGYYIYILRLSLY